VAGERPVSPASATFVAVAAHAERDGVLAPSDSARHEDERPLIHEAAVRGVAEVRSYVCAVPAVAIVLIVGLVAAPVAQAAVWDALGLLSVAAAGLCLATTWPALGRHRFALRAWDRHWTLAAVAMYVLVAGRPAVAPFVTGAFEWSLLAMVVAAVSVAGAAALAPLPGWAIAAAAVPVPGLLLTLRDARDPSSHTLWLGGSVFALIVATFLYGRWRQATQQDLESRDRLAALASARDVAIRADQEKSRFLAIASHDLRQPVHAIGLFAATLDKRLRGTAEEALVRNLNRAIDGLDQSFNVMLDISRLDAGAIEPRIQHFPVRDLFRRLHMHFAGQAEQKGLSLRLSPGGKSVSSDPQLLERVLGNLVQNAIKYTDRGGVVVVARSTASHLSIEVWDSGIGIAADDLRRVFDEFFQVGRSERARAQGLGMGLAIVKRLVSLLGHELTVSSRPGRGTMFRLRIALGGLPEIQDVTAAADTLPMPVLQARTILVLDDEEAIRDGLCMLLHEWGYEAVPAGSVGDALRVAADLDASPDLILSDLHLGDGPDGIAAIDAVRRQCGHDVAAMLITGDTTAAEIRRASESGHVLLFKPLQPRKLYDALRGMWT